MGVLELGGSKQGLRSPAQGQLGTQGTGTPLWPVVGLPDLSSITSLKWGDLWGSGCSLGSCVGLALERGPRGGCVLSRATESVPLEGSLVGLASLPSLLSLLPEYRACGEQAGRSSPRRVCLLLEIVQMWCYLYLEYGSPKNGPQRCHLLTVGLANTLVSLAEAKDLNS